METFILIVGSKRGRSRRSHRSRRACVSGFSLIEITLALGIIAFGFVTVFGLLPTGLNTFRRAMDISIGGQIAQELLNDAQQTDFDKLVGSGTSGSTGSAGGSAAGGAGSPVYHYYDEQGNEITDKTKSVYQGVLWVRSSPAIPGATDTSQSAAIIAQVAHLPGFLTVAVKGGVWDDPRVSITTCTAMVARQAQ